MLSWVWLLWEGEAWAVLVNTFGLGCNVVISWLALATVRESVLIPVIQQMSIALFGAEPKEYCGKE